MIFAELAKPAILKTMGYRRLLGPCVRAFLREDVSKRAGRAKLLRVRLESEQQRLLAFSAGDQATGMLKTLLRADGVAVLPAARSSLRAGEEFDVHLLSNNMLMEEEM